jgi:hypothetical protein
MFNRQSFLTVNVVLFPSIALLVLILSQLPKQELETVSLLKLYDENTMVNVVTMTMIMPIQISLF